MNQFHDILESEESNLQNHSIHICVYVYILCAHIHIHVSLVSICIQKYPVYTAYVYGHTSAYQQLGTLDTASRSSIVDLNV